MIHSEFVFKSTDQKNVQGKVAWKAPSNIAIVKYWGKYGQQLPKNTSLSFTLSEAFTRTTLNYQPKENKNAQLEIALDGQSKPDFLPKIKTFLGHIAPYCPYLDSFDLMIDTHNSFPHSSGIASSASGFAALALNVMSMEKQLNPSMTDDFFYKKAAFLARLGSGSATRSVKGSHVIWGKHLKIDESSDLYGIDKSYEVHKVFKDYQDMILLVDKGQKKVSSTLGHALMTKHPFADKRFEQAQNNIEQLMFVLNSGDVDSFIDIMETEALSLHAMMMTAHPYFILMQPNTLAIIHKIWNFRQDTKLPVGFTLDAGANVHVLYPKSDNQAIETFIVSELVPLCEKNQYICDHVGEGAVRLD